MSDIKPYTDPTLYNAGGDQTKRWYVSYWYINPDTGIKERFKPTFDINRLAGADRVNYANEAVKFMKEMLDRGFNPFVNQTAIILKSIVSPQQVSVNQPQLSKIELQLRPESKVNQIPSEPILTTISKARDILIKEATRNAAQTYRGMFNRFEKFISEKSLLDLTIKQVTIETVYDFQKYLKDEMKLAQKTVNSTISHVGMFWDVEFVKKLLGGVNPFRGITVVKRRDYRGKKKRELSVDNDFIPLTPDEMDTVIEYYKKIKAFDFLRLLGTIYLAWTRPVEISRLQVADVDLKNRTIRFLAENTKSDKYAHVQIVEELYELLIGIELHKYPSNYYIFSRDLKPGPHQADSWKHYTDNWWRPHVNDILGIDKKMYSIKHSGNIYFVQQNKGKVDMKWQQMQNRHESITTTERYMRRLGVYFVDTDQFKFRSFM